MSAETPVEQRLPLDKDKFKKQFDVSHFDFNAIIRGVQLTLVGGAWPTPFLQLSCSSPP